MSTESSNDNPIEAIALLDEPNRRRLYDLVAASREPVGRDEAAAGLAMSRELVAFHLDRLAEAGPLATQLRRPSGRAAPVGVLNGRGYERDVEPSSGTVNLRNCPFDALADDHQDLTCGMNLAWAQGVADGLGGLGLHPERVPRQGTCCVAFSPDAKG